MQIASPVLRRGLRERVASSPLADGETFTANLLSIFRGLWATWCGNSSVSVTPKPDGYQK